MKIRGSLRKICVDCKIVKRGRKNYVICSANARHKQRQGFSTLAAQVSMENTPVAAPATGLPTSILPIAKPAAGVSYAAMLGMLDIEGVADDEGV